MDELVTWLRAHLDDDERKVAAMEREETRVRTAPIFQGHPPDWLAGVDIFVSSTRWRAEVDAKRRMLAHIGMVVLSPGREALPAEYVAQMDWFLRLLALPYAVRDGWREEWRP
jgi:hypothetical protein